MGTNPPSMSGTVRALRRFWSSLSEYFATDDVPPPAHRITTDVGQMLGVFATALVGSVLATWIAQEMFRYNFPAMLVLALMIVLILASFLQVRGFPKRLRPLQLVVFLLSLAIVEAAIIAFIYVSSVPPISYIVFDATDATIPYYPELVKNIRLAAQVQNPKSLGGLRVYGAGLSGESSCDDTKQLIAPITADLFEDRLDEAFGRFDPRGNASLTIAILAAIQDDLRDFRGPVKLIVVTSGVDSKCEPAYGGIFEKLTDELRAARREEITMAVIGVGDLSTTEEATLKNYAQSLGGNYLNASKPATIPALILAPESYLSGQQSERP